MKILINTPSLNLPGGVANHYKGLRPFWRHDVNYNTVGRRGWLPGFFALPYDYIKFAITLLFGRYDVVLLNPSLGATALARDALFLAISKCLGIPVVVFFHGWNAAQQRSIDLNPTSFVRKFGKADAIICLADEFSYKIRSWGFENTVHLSSTKVDDGLLRGFDINNKKYGLTLLFLARIEVNKGILIALDAFSRVVEVYPDARFLVAGSGKAYDAAVRKVKSKAIPNVEMLGNLSGQKLVDAFSESHVYILPTMHGEGMPTSVLEAMAFGLPVIARPVGGVKDLFLNEKMGFISDSLCPEWYADTIIKLFSSPNLMKKIGEYNHSYAKEHFMASKVARQIEVILEGSKA